MRFHSLASTVRMAVAQIGALVTLAAGTGVVAADLNTNYSDIKTAFNNLVTGADTIGVGVITETFGGTGVAIDGVRLKDKAVQLNAATVSASLGFSTRVQGEGVDRYQMNYAGKMLWSPGNAASDTSLERTGVGELTAGEAFKVGGDLTVSGDVGIGTSNPDHSIEIRSATPVIRLRDTGDTATATAAFVEFGGTTAAAWSRTGYVGDPSSGTTDIALVAEQSDLHLGDSSGSTVINLQGGNVGIGETAPDSKLEVNGTFHVIGASAFDSFITIDDTDEWLLLTDTVTSGSVDLTFQNASTGAGAAGFQIGITATEKAILLNYENTDMLFHVNNALAATLAPGGNLTLVGGLTAGALTVSGLTTLQRDSATVTDPTVVLQNLDETAATLHTILQRYQFNTTASATVNAVEWIYSKEQDWTSTGTTQDTKSSLWLAQDGSLVEVLRMLGSDKSVEMFGSLGVGITPTSPLHISGQARFDSEVAIGRTPISNQQLLIRDSGVSGNFVLNFIDPAATQNILVAFGTVGHAEKNGAVIMQNRVGIGTSGGAFGALGQLVHLKETETIAGTITDGYAAALRLDPGYTAATALNVARHNYIDVQDASLAGAGPASLTDAPVFRFDAAAGTHKALTTEAVKINVNGTLQYMPFYPVAGPLVIPIGATLPIVAKTANYIATVADHTINCDTSAGGFTVTLFAATVAAGFILEIKQEVPSANSLTVDGDGTDTIDNALTATFSYPTSLTIQSDGVSNWVII